MLGHESQLLTGTLCAVFHCWEWKKLSTEVEKGLSTCREPSLIVPPRSRCRGAPAGQRPPHFCKTASEQQEKTTLHKKPLAAPTQPLSLCWIRAPDCWGRGHPPFSCNRQGTTTKSCWKTLSPRNATQTGARSQLYPLHIFLQTRWIFFFNLQLRRQSFNPTKHATFCSALKIDTQLQRPTPRPSLEKQKRVD